MFLICWNKEDTIKVEIDKEGNIVLKNELTQVYILIISCYFMVIEDINSQITGAVIGLTKNVTLIKINNNTINIINIDLLDFTILTSNY